MNHKKIIRLIIAFLVSFSLFLNPIFGIGSTVQAATESELKAKQAQLESKQANIKSKISQLEQSQSTAQETVNAVNELISNLEEQIATVNTKILVQEQQLKEIQAQIDEKDNQIEKCYEEFKQRVRSLYISGDITGGLELLLSASDFNSLLTTMAYIDVVSEHDSDIVSALTDDKQEYLSQRALCSELLTEVEAEKAKLAEKKEQLDEQKHQADALLSQISADKAVLQEEQIKIDKEMASARAALDAIINAAAAKSTNEDYVGGTWKWPAPGYRTITSKFGWRSWSQSYHKGIDIAAPTGANIVASNAGVIVTSSYNPGGYGNYVIIDHGGGYMTVYGHLSHRSVGVGQKVSRGQVVGLCGSTGRSTGPHLHFEIRVNGVAQNPTNYL